MTLEQGIWIAVIAVAVNLLGTFVLLRGLARAIGRTIGKL